jgi:glycosyltransferase involved in cell wall biosynthesis
MPAVGSKEKKPVARNEHSKFQILSIGRFVAMKGFDITIEAFSLFVDSLPSEDRELVSLMIVGAGPGEGRIRKLIDKQGMNDYIIIAPWVPKDQVGAYYINSDLFLFPSHEGAGMVVPEALSYGVPVLCLNNHGPGELINDASGLRVSSKFRDQAIKDLSVGLRRFFGNPKMLKTMSDGAYSLFKSKYEWSNKGEVLGRIYNDLLVENDQKPLMTQKIRA